MQSAALPLLACPAPRDKGQCGGMFELGAAAGLPLRHAVRDTAEVQEGALRCRGCGTEFPVLSGVALLVPRPDRYVRRYHDALRRDLARHGELSPAVDAWLARRGRDSHQKDYGADFRFSQQFEEPADVARALTPEPDALYGGYAGWLRSLRGVNPYNVLSAWAGSLAPGRALALDAGCGGGGLVARLAPQFQAVFGVDLSFLAVLLARRAVLHRPEAERAYRLPVRRGLEVERLLAVPRAENAELVVGDCAALPFAPGLFDAVCSSNIIDIAGIEGPLRAAAAALRPEGLLLLSDPFFFREGEAPEGHPVTALHTVLDTLELRVEQVRDGVPWAWATYDRHWRVYFNYCLAARRAATLAPRP